MTKFEKITKNPDELAKFIVFAVKECKDNRRLVKRILLNKNGTEELKRAIIEWLQGECDADDKE